ncbi:MAG: DRTGG domain-containing protein [Bryobacterales bacterium]|nr:DRTGG domain-containing protein [Bryobacteraceae bacterium]MDW8129503.1 DRTGG domain-containing protein [Bryobacterales bacterium]
MTLRALAETLGLEVLSAWDLDREVTGAYVADLLSDVLAHAAPGSLWITLQTHANVAAVAALKELSVLLANGRRPDPDMLERAREHKVTVLATGLPAFEIAGRLYAAGLRGGN